MPKRRTKKRSKAKPSEILKPSGPEDEAYRQNIVQLLDEIDDQGDKNNENDLLPSESQPGADDLETISNQPETSSFNQVTTVYYNFSGTDTKLIGSDSLSGFRFQNEEDAVSHSPIEVVLHGDLVLNERLYPKFHVELDDGDDHDVNWSPLASDSDGETYEEIPRKFAKTNARSTAKPGGRSKDAIWNHFLEVQNKSKSRPKWQCKYCSNPVSGEARRLRSHYDKCSARLANLHEDRSDLATTSVESAPEQSVSAPAAKLTQSKITAFMDSIS